MTAVTSRPRPRSAPARPAPRRSPLRIVRPDERVRTVGAIGTLVAAFFFVVLFALAGLHAVVVQTQAEIDTINADIVALEEARDAAIARRAWFGSPVGLAEAALAAGLVPAPEVVMLTHVAPGQLDPPATPDPFGPGPDPSTVGGAAG